MYLVYRVPEISHSIWLVSRISFRGDNRPVVGELYLAQDTRLDRRVLAILRNASWALDYQRADGEASVVYRGNTGRVPSIYFRLTHRQKGESRGKFNLFIAGSKRTPSLVSPRPSFRSVREHGCKGCPILHFLNKI